MAERGPPSALCREKDTIEIKAADRESMASPVFRKIALAGLAVVIAAALMILSLPMLASTSFIRGRIIQELGSLTGHQVRIGQAPEVSIFPDLSVRLRDVQLSPWGQPDVTAMATPEMTIGLSALSAVSGKIGFTSFTLVKPVFHLPGEVPAWPEPDVMLKGQLGDALAQIKRQIGSTDGKEVPAGLPNRTIGSINLINGSVRTGTGDNQTEVISSLNARIGWPRLNAALKAEANGVWNGESFKFNVESGQPLMLLAGAQSPLVAAFTSPLLSFTYSGTFGMGSILRADGSLVIESSKPTSATRWLRLPHVTSVDPGPMELAATVSADNGRIKLEKLTLMISKGTGTGTAEISRPGRQPLISGALDFDFLNLDTVMSGLASAPPDQMQSEERIEARSWIGISLDLRLSASAEKLAGLDLSDVAATVQVKDGLAAFDISDATAFAGVVQAGLRINSDRWPYTGELRILATDIDGRMVGNALGDDNRFPRGTGTVSLILEGTAQTWRQLLEQSKGSFSAKFVKGSIPDLDAALFQRLVKSGGFFGLQSIAGTPFPFDVAELETTIANGTATIQKAEIRNSDLTARFSGVIPYADRSLALSGALLPSAPQQQGDVAAEPTPAGETDRFFVGGSWTSPFVSPVLNGPGLRP